LLNLSHDSRGRRPLTAPSDKPRTGFGRCPERQRQFRARPHVAILQWRYQRPIASERQHSEHRTHHPNRPTIHHIDRDLGTAHTLARKATEAVATRKLQHAIEGRLLALGRAHDLLLQARWTSADLGTIVRSATEAFDNPDQPKFSISGPDIRMVSGAVIAIGMTLNELCTNTTKFGALSVPQGRVDIRWALDQQTQRLHLTWTEKNGAAVRPPEKRSFGTRLIETLGRQLRGDVRLTYEPTGFVYAFDVPMASLTSAAA